MSERVRLVDALHGETRRGTYAVVHDGTITDYVRGRPGTPHTVTTSTVGKVEWAGVPNVASPGMAHAEGQKSLDLDPA